MWITYRSPGPRAWRPVLFVALTAGWAWASVWAQPADAWHATLTDNRQMRVVQDPTYRAAGYVLERSYPDGRLDESFGTAGRVLFTMGPDNAGPAALRADALGRAWLAGTQHEADRSQAVVLRFTPQGQPDPTFANNGRAVHAPSGRQAQASDVTPLPDSSAWVTGIVQDATGQERAGWWRLKPDGAVDVRFGLGGLWESEQGGQAVAQVVRSDGQVVLLVRAVGAQPVYDVWVADGSALGMPRLHARLTPKAELDLAQWRQAVSVGALTPDGAGPVGVEGATQEPAAAQRLSFAQFPGLDTAVSAVGAATQDGAGVPGWVIALGVAVLGIFGIAGYQRVARKRSRR